MVPGAFHLLAISIVSIRVELVGRRFVRTDAGIRVLALDRFSSCAASLKPCAGGCNWFAFSVSGEAMRYMAEFLFGTKRYRYNLFIKDDYSLGWPDAA
jgi:hypothetical protein